MDRGLHIPLVRGQNTMGKWVFIPWIGGQNTMERGRYTMGRGSNTMDRGIKIPWVWGSIYHGEVQSLKHRTLLARRVPSSCQKNFDGFLLLCCNFKFEGILFRMSDCLCRPTGFNSFRAKVRDLVA